nr:RNA-directed DNA polymerase, eukaryota [Tanacetum cinerariifolium]
SNLLGVGIPKDMVESVASDVGCSSMLTPFKYLGVMVGDNITRVSAWDDVVRKIKLSLSNWKKLSCVFPRLFALDEDKDCNVASKFHGPVELSFRRAIRGGVESSQFSQLREMLDSVILSNIEDLDEDISHLLFRCPMASDIHRLICRWWDLSWSQIGSYMEWLSWFKDIRLGSIIKSLLEGVFYVSWWGGYSGGFERTYSEMEMNNRLLGCRCICSIKMQKMNMHQMVVYDYRPYSGFKCVGLTGFMCVRYHTMVISYQISKWLCYGIRGRTSAFSFDFYQRCIRARTSQCIPTSKCTRLQIYEGELKKAKSEATSKIRGLTKW